MGGQLWTVTIARARVGSLSTARALLPAALVPLVVAGCAGQLSTLDPAGPQAQQMADLGWLMFGLSVAIMGLVSVLIGWALWRARRPREDEPPPVSPTKLILGGGVLLPLMVLPVIWVLSLGQMGNLARPAEPLTLVIEVTGRQFEYQVDYPGHAASLRNEIRMPTGEPVLFRLRSEDVIHSFWVPRLGGKVDLVPGQLNEHWLEASVAGTYEGRCAEYCGIGHTAMGLVVIAQEPADFAAWLAAQEASE
ncbi:MAG TPA: cytochrome c oxidase subunit II [Candidatus Limnocylindria bacterium]|jgi:cytochrome c oxidase subunit II|nr:cytochrome c oxidase subunit II [Candidatus Limnocylindria bacterium]